MVLCFDDPCAVIVVNLKRFYPFNKIMLLLSWAELICLHSLTDPLLRPDILPSAEPDGNRL